MRRPEIARRVRQYYDVLNGRGEVSPISVNYAVHIANDSKEPCALWLYTVMLVAFFLPGAMIPGVGKVWPADILVLSTIAWRVFYRPRVPATYRSHYTRTLLLPYLAMLGWLTFITCLTTKPSYGSHLPLVFAGLLGRFRPLLFFWFLMPYCYTRERLRRTVDLALLLFGFELLICLCQKSNLFAVNSWYTPHFRLEGEEASYIYLMGIRAIGTIGNPNSLGTFFSVFGSFGFVLFLFAAGRHKWIGLCTSCLALWAIVFACQTRQGAICLLAACALAAIVAFLRNRIGRVFVAGATSVAVVLIGMIVFSEELALMERFGVFLGRESILEVDSLAVRLDLWPQFLKTYGTWIITGKGMYGQLMSIVWDSGWLSMLVAGGIPLVALYIWWNLNIAIASFKVLIQRGHSWKEPLLVTPVCIVFLVVLTNVVNTTFWNTLVAVSIGLLYAVAVGAAYDDKYDRSQLSVVVQAHTPTDS